MSGPNANYIDYMYTQWQKDPASVHSSWDAYFQGSESGASAAFEAPPSLGKTSVESQIQQLVTMLTQGTSPGVMPADTTRVSDESIRLTVLLRAFMTHGHLVANIDPLNLKEVYKDSPTLATKFRFPDDKLKDLLDPLSYGFTKQDMKREFYYSNPYAGAIGKQKTKWTLEELIGAYRDAYCQNIGVEFMHIEDREICTWIRTKFEGIQFEQVDDKTKMHMYERLNEAHQWGQFMALKFLTNKRFGLEGCESFIPGLQYLIDVGVEQGVREVVIGMPHRGRLNTLANVVRKRRSVIMAELQGITPDMAKEENAGAGDVKYHLGTSFVRKYGELGTEVRMTLMANPSHLEAVNPCVGGRVRAE